MHGDIKYSIAISNLKHIQENTSQTHKANNTYVLQSHTSIIVSLKLYSFTFQPIKSVCVLTNCSIICICIPHILNVFYILSTF